MRVCACGCMYAFICFRVFSVEVIALYEVLAEIFDHEENSTLESAIKFANKLFFGKFWGDILSFYLF